MKQVNANTLNYVLDNYNYQEQQQQHNQVADTAELVNATFANLTGIFTAWKYALPTIDAINTAKNQWLIAFTENRITAQDVQLGLRVARHHDGDFIPSVGKFINWINQEKYKLAGISDCERIRNLYLESRKSSLQDVECSDYEYWILNGLYANNVKTLSNDKLEKLIKTTREEAIERFKSGKGVPEKSIAIQDKSQEPFVIPLTPPTEEERQVTEDGLKLLKMALGRA